MCSETFNTTGLVVSQEGDMFSLLKRLTWKAGLLTMLLSLLGFTIALAASGDLDATFSGDGRQTTDFSGSWSDEINAIALQSDGKIVAVGERYQPLSPFATTQDFALARYKSNGNLDLAFSGDGKVLTDFGGVDSAHDVAIQSSGKIVVSGVRCNTSSVCDLALARYNPNGALDPTFSGDGKQVVSFGSSNGTEGGLAIQADGKIVVAGFMTNGAGDSDFAAYRLNPNGTLDASFSGDGKVNFGFGAGRQDAAFNMVLQGSKIVLGGYTCNAASTSCNFALARLTATGALDLTFSGDGRQTTDFGADDYVRSLALQPDGKLVAAGFKNTATTGYCALARYKDNGALDSTFSGDGRQIVSFGTGSRARDVLVQPGGKIVIAGYAYNGTDPDFTLARLLPNGNLDTTFSGDGRVMFNFGGNNDQARGLVRQGDGKYVLGGFTYDGAQSDFALVRVMP
jgi:uncharacterized delta-60 repeat protein